MKHTLTKLEVISELLEDKVTYREDYYNERNESWIESDKGDEYISKTELLEGVQSLICDAIVDLQEFLEQ